MWHIRISYGKFSERLWEFGMSFDAMFEVKQ